MGTRQHKNDMGPCFYSIGNGTSCNRQAEKQQFDVIVRLLRKSLVFCNIIALVGNNLILTTDSCVKLQYCCSNRGYTQLYCACATLVRNRAILLRGRGIKWPPYDLWSKIVAQEQLYCAAEQHYCAIGQKNRPPYDLWAKIYPHTIYEAKLPRIRFLG